VGYCSSGPFGVFLLSSVVMYAFEENGAISCGDCISGPLKVSVLFVVALGFKSAGEIG
jgi:hypothetical protein